MSLATSGCIGQTKVVGAAATTFMPHLGQVPGSLLVTSGVLVMPLGRRRR